LRNADDRERRAVQVDHLADDVRIGTEPSLPESLAEDSDGIRTWCAVIVWRNRASEIRPRPERPKVVARDKHSRQQGRSFAAAELNMGVSERGNVLEARISIAKGHIVGIRQRAHVGPGPTPAHERDFFRSTDRVWRVEQERVHDAKNGSGGADPKGQGQPGRTCQPRLPS